MRLQALEAVLIEDASHAVPHTRRWLLYWTDVIGKLMSGELDRSTLPGLIPLEAYRAVFNTSLAGGPESDEGNYAALGPA